MALNDRQEAFALAYALSGNATEAALKVGYSAQTAYSQGCRLLKHVEVRAKIDQQRGEIADQAIVTVQWVLARLVAVYEKSFQGAPKVLSNGRLAFDADGNPIMEWSPGGANKALELIGKHLAMFTDRADVHVTVSRDLIEQSIADLEDQLAANDPEHADA
jgi:phage terminase small subunit